METPLWQPTEELLNHSNMARFIQFIRVKEQVALIHYNDLYQFSITHPERFWSSVADFCEIIFSKKTNKVLIHPEKMLEAQWFVGAELNFAENLLKHKDLNKPAIIFRNENGEKISLTYPELFDQVQALATSLINEGITKGDRIAGYLPNRPETVIAMLATASIGAIWTSCSLDFGYHGVYDRFQQIKPKILFSANGHFYNGKWFDSLAVLKQLQDTLPSLKKIIMINNSAKKLTTTELNNAELFSEFLSKTPKPLKFTQVLFNHPLYILFSSGTTGVPKCIVHSVGGTLIQHLKELILHTDLKKDDTIFYYSTCGWMMWNWLVSSLAVGATIVLYDGSPLFPNPNRLLDLIDEVKITIFGTSAKHITALEKAGLTPKKTHQLNQLKSILSTGSPLVPKNYDYVYSNIKSDLRLCSISGGTDIISCFALGNPLLPIFRGELQCRGLGMKVEVYDEKGKSIHHKKGELVCTAPFPSMPIYFWNDPDQEKYKKAYFQKFPNVWAHGDFAEITIHDGVIIYGRSDTLLKPGGIRIGTAEIYREVEHFDEILESIAVGQPRENDEIIILFVVMKQNYSLTPELIQKIKQSIKQNVSPHHVPSKIISVPDIPRTISGKIVEMAVRNIILGKPIENIDAIANPESLKYFKKL